MGVRMGGGGMGGHAPTPVNLCLSTFIRQRDSTSDVMQFYADLVRTSHM